MEMLVRIPITLILYSIYFFTFNLHKAENLIMLNYTHDDMHYNKIKMNIFLNEIKIFTWLGQP